MPVTNVVRVLRACGPCVYVLGGVAWVLNRRALAVLRHARRMSTGFQDTPSMNPYAVGENAFPAYKDVVDRRTSVQESGAYQSDMQLARTMTNTTYGPAAPAVGVQQWNEQQDSISQWASGNAGGWHF